MNKGTNELNKNWKDNKHEEDSHSRNSTDFEGENLLRQHLSVLCQDSSALVAYEDVSQQKLELAEVVKA